MKRPFHSMPKFTPRRCLVLGLYAIVFLLLHQILTSNWVTSRTGGGDEVGIVSSDDWSQRSKIKPGDPMQAGELLEGNAPHLNGKPVDMSTDGANTKPQAESVADKHKTSQNPGQPQDKDSDSSSKDRSDSSSSNTGTSGSRSSSSMPTSGSADRPGLFQMADEPSSLQSPNEQKLPTPMKRYSEIECRNSEKTMSITNLYFINKQFHVFLTRPLPDECKKAKAILGIGFRSAIVSLEEAHMEDQQLSDADLFDKYEGTTGAPDGQYKILVHVGRTPPTRFGRTQTRDFVKYHPVPVALFCTLWENFFRTIYAGVGAWYTMMSYRVFFPHHHQLILVDPSPTKYLHLLQSVTPYPVIPFSAMKPGVYKAVVFGISRDSHLGEIELEKDRGWRHMLRSLALRSFCEKIKTQLLSGRSERRLDPAAQVERFNMQYNSLIIQINEELAKIEKANEDTVQDHRLIFKDDALCEKKNGMWQMTVVIRKSSRLILNFEELMTEMRQSFPSMNITTYDFDQYEFAEQVAIIDQSDIFLSMHGAALAHAVFLRPGSYLIELFPYGFRKIIYQNLARSVGVYYAHWQNKDPLRTVFHWEVVEGQRFTDRPKAKIISEPVDWHNMDSKNYWRNQDTVVNSKEIVYVVDRILNQLDSPEATKYLVYLPWEQINNQLIGLKSACAVSKMTNRVLVLPYVGLKRPVEDPQDRLLTTAFRPSEYDWNEMEEYLDSERLVKLPCKWVSADNFLGLSPAATADVIRMHDLGSGSTDLVQMREYYDNIIALAHGKIETLQDAFHLSKSRVMEINGADTAPVVALGSMFWYYDFGLKVSYPLTSYHDYMRDGDSIYQRIMDAIRPRSRVTEFAAVMRTQLLADAQEVGLGSTGLRIIAVHVRRGDYKGKCETAFLNPETNNKDMFDNCYVSDQDLAKYLTEHYLNSEILIYISTNDIKTTRKKLIANWRADKSIGKDGPTYDFSGLIGNLPNYLRTRVFFHGDLYDSAYDTFTSSTPEPPNNTDPYAPSNLVFGFSVNAVIPPFDQVDRVLIDQWFCVLADEFVGNHWSSFSRHVAEWRFYEQGKSDSVKWFQ